MAEREEIEEAVRHHYAKAARAVAAAPDAPTGGGCDSQRGIGKVYGLDPTDEMLDLARSNQGRAGVDNVEFLKGHMESIPLPEASVDVVLSNCVIALSVDKAAVFSEAHRVLRAGGRFAAADVVTQRTVGPPQQADAATWADCASGALTEAEYRTALAAAGFVDASISPSHAVEHDLTSVIVRASKS